MDQKNKLLELLKQELNDNKDFILLKKYESIIDIARSCQENYNNFTKLLHTDVTFIENEQFQEYFQLIKNIYQYEIKEIVDEDEIKNLIDMCIEIIISIYNQIHEKMSPYFELEQAIEENNNENLILDFIMQCYEKKYININELFKLNFYVATAVVKDKENIFQSEDVEYTIKDDYNIDDSECMVIDENSNQEDLEERIKNIFVENEIEYDQIPEKIRKELVKYAKPENIQKVFNFLNNNIKNQKFTKEEILSRIKIIAQIMIYYDEKTITNISNFLSQNNCTLSYMIRLNQIFFPRKRKYKFRHQEADGSFIDAVTPKTLPVGDNESFMYCVNLIKQSLGKDENYRLTDEDLGKKSNGDGYILFLTSPKEKIEKNLSILKRYKILEEGEILPKSISATQGTHTEYLLDRFIETGLYGYVKKRQSCLKTFNNDHLRWYKLKRAISIGDKITSTSGLKKELTNEEEMYSISQQYNTDGTVSIIQTLDGYSIEKRPDLTKPYFVEKTRTPKQQNFDYFFKYKIENPISIFNHNNPYDQSNLGTQILTIFNEDYNVAIDALSSIENDEYIRRLDKMILKLEDGSYYSIKKDDLTYVFNFIQTKNEDGTPKWPGGNIYISRQKVLRLCYLLKQNGLWLDPTNTDEINTSILLSVILKDTIISIDERNKMRNLIQNKLNYIMGGRHI